MKKNEDSKKYVWKGPYVEGVQEEIDLWGCDQFDLQKYYNHCEEMLNNPNLKSPGRYVLINNIDKQIQNCRAELLVRWLRSERGYTYNHCYEDIHTLIRKNSETGNQENIENWPISNLMSEIPDEYKRVPIGLVLKASMSALGVCDTSTITLNFLTNLGIYLTQKELQKDLIERDPVSGKIRNRLDVIKEREHLNPAIRLKIKENGLSYEEFHQMYRLHTDKYERLTTLQLKILSEKVFYLVQIRCKEQAAKWEEKKSEILEVAKEKGYKLNENPF
jgi:hypothetical protein